jgi:uncharacterized protein YjbI with pentapeptide repeats
MQGLSQWLQGHTIPITFVATLLLLPIGVWLLRVDNQGTWRRDLGVALVTGSLFFAASLFVQVSFESSNFRMTIAVTNDLTGFDANGRALEGVTLAGKTLYRANLKGARLVESDLSSANLTEAKLEGAQLERANLAYAVFLRADLRDVNLRNADLRGAELSTDVSTADVSGAKVHRETCWRVPLEDKTLWFNEYQPVAKDYALIRRLTSSLKPLNGRTLGHVCDQYEETRAFGQQTGEPDKRDDPRVYICQDGSLRARVWDDRDVACDGPPPALAADGQPSARR